MALTTWSNRNMRWKGIEYWDEKEWKLKSKEQMRETGWEVSQCCNWGRCVTENSKKKWGGWGPQRQNSSLTSTRPWVGRGEGKKCGNDFLKVQTLGLDSLSTNPSLAARPGNPAPLLCALVASSIAWNGIIMALVSLVSLWKKTKLEI